MTRKKITEALFRAQNGFCASCGKGMLLYQSGVYFDNTQVIASIDHLKARRVGGVDSIENMVAMHRGCNSAKGHRQPTGCELIFLSVVHAKLEIVPLAQVQDGPGKATLGDVWPKETA